MSQKRIVYVVRYSHRHGGDIWACSTEEKAEKSIGDTIIEYIEELGYGDKSDDAAKKKIKKYIKAGKQLQAARLWYGFMDEEFEIHKLEIDHGR